MERQLQFVTNELRPHVQRVVKNGRRFLVAPISLIVPGVLNGSKGALYYPPAECGRDFSYWDGKPITLQHPADPLTNEAVPAETPGVWERQGLGVLQNTEMNGKLRALGWFDEELTRARDPRVYNALLQGRTMEISTGLYTDNHPARGTFNGRRYDFIARNYQPDHLAILPDQIGACSVNDGCGLNVNSRTKEGKPIANGALFLDRQSRGAGGVIPRRLRRNAFQPGQQSRGMAGQFGVGAGGKPPGGPAGGGGQINPQELHQSIIDSLKQGPPDESDPGKPSWQPDQPGDEDKDKDVDKGKGKGATKNANPEGHNQYTGGHGRLHPNLRKQAEALMKAEQEHRDKGYELTTKVNDAGRKAREALQRHGKDSDEFKAAKADHDKAWQEAKEHAAKGATRNAINPKPQCPT